MNGSNPNLVRRQRRPPHLSSYPRPYLKRPDRIFRSVSCVARPSDLKARSLRVPDAASSVDPEVAQHCVAAAESTSTPANHAHATDLVDVVVIVRYVKIVRLFNGNAAANPRRSCEVGLDVPVEVRSAMALLHKGAVGALPRVGSVVEGGSGAA